MAASDQYEPKPLTAEEEALWRAFSRVILLAPRALEADLLRASRLNYAEYYVLVYLSEQEDRTLRMSNLSELNALSPSGMTRVVGRLARRGLIERRRSADDGRGQVAILTAEGMRRLETAWPLHLASVRARVLDHLDALDRHEFLIALEAIAEACAREGQLRPSSD
jgi:DNA-binding MarR family transcriptional regulator